MKEITSKRNGMTQIVTDEEWQWLKDNHRSRDFTASEMEPPKMLTLPKILSKEIIKPTPEITKTKTKKK